MKRGANASADRWKPTRNHIERLTEPPKHHLADPALATTLLGLTGQQLLAGDEPAVTIPRDGTFLGALFESLVVGDGHEVDDVLGHDRPAFLLRDREQAVVGEPTESGPLRDRDSVVSPPAQRLGEPRRIHLGEEQPQPSAACARCHPSR
ncbi:MAG: hypothetical protein M3433_00785 [Actinomycetota bacterium]|nr:hypothetical protein [Actinomycetota bacterium]